MLYVNSPPYCALGVWKKASFDFIYRVKQSIIGLLLCTLLFLQEKIQFFFGYVAQKQLLLIVTVYFFKN